MHFLSTFQEKLDPFSLVADELSVLANRLRSMVVAEVSDYPIYCILVSEGIATVMTFF